MLPLLMVNAAILVNCKDFLPHEQLW